MSEAFDLLAAKIEHAKRQMQDEFERQLFTDGLGMHMPVRRLTWRERLQRRLWRVRGYFSTLWMALKGQDPYDYDYD